MLPSYTYLPVQFVLIGVFRQFVGRNVPHIGKVQLALFDNEPHQVGYGQGRNDGKHHDSVEKVVGKHPQIFTDRRCRQRCRKLRHGHQTGANTFAAVEAGKLHGKEAGKHFAAHQTDNGVDYDRQVICRFEDEPEVGFHTNRDTQKRYQQAVQSALNRFVMRFV